MPSHRLPRAIDLPALAAFTRAYLHEDAIAEYGGGLDAATTFGRDASPEERRQLVEDLERVIRVFESRSTGRVARFFTQELRAAWAPATVADLRSMIARVKGEPQPLEGATRKRRPS